MKNTILFILTLTFFSSYSQGLKFKNPDEYKNASKLSSPSMGELPNKIDLSDNFPKPGNQGTQPSCVGWSVAYGLKSYHEAIETKSSPNNFTKIFSPSYIYNQFAPPGCGGGMLIEDALNKLKDEGVSRYVDFPYNEFNCNTKPTGTVKDKAKNFKISDWGYLNPNDIISIKSQLNNKFPVIIGMNFGTTFRNLGNNQIYRGESGFDTGKHAMVVVGYDDSKRAFKLFNSWGQSWGTNGYGWIDYQTFTRKVKEAYIALDAKSNTAVIQDNDELDVDDDITLIESSISYSISNLRIKYNVVNNNINGMVINVDGFIKNGIGSNAQIIVRFSQPNGKALICNVNELNYRDSYGYVAAGTPQGPINVNNVNLNKYPMPIPYYALNFRNTGGAFRYDLKAQAFLYINGFEKARSNKVDLWIRY
jgi:hypothetical protein